MASLSEKPDITFETESDIHDEVKSLVDKINSEFSPNDPKSAYLVNINAMFQLFEEIYAKNVKLLSVCQEMNAQVIVNASKIKAILKVTEDGKDDLRSLKSDFDEVSKMVTLAHQSENKAKDLLASLRKKVDTLTEQVQRGEAFSFGTEESVFEASQDVKNLIKERDNASKEIASLLAQISSIKTKIKGLNEAMTGLQKESDKIDASLQMYEKQRTDILSVKDDCSKNIVQIKPEIFSQRKELESIQKKKNDLQKKSNQDKQAHNDIIAVLTNVKDESKNLKERLFRLTKTLNEVKLLLTNKESNIDNVNHKIEDANQDIEKVNAELDSLEKSSKDYENKLNDVLQISKGLSDEKMAMRQKVRQLRSEIIKLQLTLSKSDNEVFVHNRHITTSKIELLTQKKQRYNASKETEEVKSQNITVKAETKYTKSYLQVMKEKILHLYQEIDEKRSEKFQIIAKMQMTKESTGILNEQHQQHMEILKEYERKIQDQIYLIEDVREERNNYKKQYEQLAKESQEIQNQLNQIIAENNELSTKYENLKQWIINAHFENINTKSRIYCLGVLTEKSQKGIYETERITSRIQAECQTLNFILTQSQHEKLQQQQETQLLENNLRLVRNELSSKTKKYENIKSQIQSDEAYIKKCSKLFQDKSNDINDSLLQLKSLQQKTRDLEQKREKLSNLEFEMHRLFTERMTEQTKCSSLIHEFSIPRNIHRWHQLSAVDPSYVKQLKYRSILSSKIEKAHEELLNLQKERDSLKQQYAQLSNKTNNSLSINQVQNYINQYKEDIRLKDMQLKELRLLVNENKPDIEKSIQSLEGIRSKVTQRRGATSSLNIRVNQLKQQTQNSGQPWFITEAPLYAIYGGGFVSKPEKPRNQNTTIEDSSELTIGSSEAPSYYQHRPLSSLVSPTIRKIARPLKTANPRSRSRIQPKF